MSTDRRRPYKQAKEVAEEVAEKLARFCRRIEIAGSIRRQERTVGDIEIVAIARYPEAMTVKDGAMTFGPDYTQPSALDLFFEAQKVPLICGGRKYKKGQRERLKRFRYRGFQVDMALATPDNWGAVFLIRTGNRDFSKWLVTQQTWGGGMPYGMRMEEGSLWRGDEQLVTPEEEDCFREMGLPFIPVEARRDQRWLALLEKEVEKG